MNLLLAATLGRGQGSLENLLLAATLGLGLGLAGLLGLGGIAAWTEPRLFRRRLLGDVHTHPATVNTRRAVNTQYK